MLIFLAILLVAAMLATLFVLIKGLVNMAGTTQAELEDTSEGPSPRALRSNKLMQQRILLQGGAIAIIALILIIMSAKG
ncbi:MAG: twin transmembrane helix small protein [Pseudomonadota bacterium]